MLFIYLWIIEPNDPKKLEGYATKIWYIDSFHDEWFVNAEVTIGSHDEKDLSAKVIMKSR